MVNFNKFFVHKSIEINLSNVQHDNLNLRKYRLVQLVHLPAKHLHKLDTNTRQTRGGCNPKKPKKKTKKPVLNLKFAVALGFFRFFCGTFSVFFGLNFDKKFQPFKNHVNNEVLGGQELPNNTLNAYKALQMANKSYIN